MKLEAGELLIRAPPCALVHANELASTHSHESSDGLQLKQAYVLGEDSLIEFRANASAGGVLEDPSHSRGFACNDDSNREGYQAIADFDRLAAEDGDTGDAVRVSQATKLLGTAVIVHSRDREGVARCTEHDRGDAATQNGVHNLDF